MTSLKLSVDEMTVVKVVTKSVIDAFENSSVEIEYPPKDLNLSARKFIDLVMSAYMKISYSLRLCETEDETEDEKRGIIWKNL